MQTLDDTWKIWIWKNVERGCRKDHIFKALHDRGFDYEVIRRELGYEPIAPLGEIAVPMVPSNGAAPVAADLTRTELAPGLFVAPGVLSREECATLIDAARDKLTRCTVVSDANRRGEEGEAVSEIRTNSTACFGVEDAPSPAFAAVAARLRALIAELAGLPESHLETVQILRYQVGEKFDAHHDAFPPGSEYLRGEGRRGGQRVFSAMVYLNDVEGGGATEFPKLELSVPAEAGKTIYWANIARDGTRLTQAWHAGTPVLAGEKWVLVCWVREHPFGLPTADYVDLDSGGLDRWLDPAPVLEPPGWLIENTAAQQASVPHLAAGGPGCPGFEKRAVPPDVFGEIRSVYASAREKLDLEQGNAVGTYIGTVRPGMPPTLVYEQPELNALVLELLKPMHEEWCGFELEPSACYGFRVYLAGAYLHAHVDRPATHVISSTICIDHDLYAPWPLRADGIDGTTHAVDLAPGELLLYESARIAHGRPTPLNGRLYAALFVHYRPAVDAALWESAPGEWSAKHRPA